MDTELRENDWLNHRAEQFYSQRGEEGGIQTILSLLGDQKKWCVVFTQFFPASLAAYTP